MQPHKAQNRASASRHVEVSTLAKFLNENQLAEMLSMSVKTLRKWRLFGQGPPFHRFQSSVRYSATEVQEWIDGNRVAGSGGRVA